jgi:hypothetical protein
MILPPELQKYIYVLDDAPYALEAIVRYCAGIALNRDPAHTGTYVSIMNAFGLDVPNTKTG